MSLQKQTDKEKLAWQKFVTRFSLTEKQEQELLSYLSFLLQENKKFNITAITDFEKIINDHLIDSLVLSEKMDLTACKTLVDVGTGGGLPAIPLKILYPHLAIVLIEVNQKKANFLEEVITLLDLKDVEVCDQDWRSFLRGYDKTADVVISRASLSVAELLRMFRSSMLKDSILVYWASKFWNATKQEAVYLQREEEYDVDQKSRRLVFFEGKKGA